MLHNRRKRLEQQQKQEAAGVNLWTDVFEPSVRTKILHAFRDAAGDSNMFEYSEYARSLILRDEGLLFLTSQGMNGADDFLNYLMGCPDDMVPTVVEAMCAAFSNRALLSRTYRYDAQSLFTSTVPTVLREHRVSYDLVDGRMVEFSSREMHEAVVVPALTLLAGRRDFASVESAYHDALDEISKGKPGDAITDAGTALQEALVTLGCDGNALGPLIKSAKSKGLLATHDGPLLDAIDKMLHWVSADRSESGDAHAAARATVEDAWLIVHVVGALILRLVQGGPRNAGRA